MNTWKTLSVAAAAAVAAGGMVGGALATDAGTVELAQAEGFSDGKLRSFVVATAAVDEVRQEYDRRLQEVESEDGRSAVVREAQSEMAAAVEETDGITVQEYNQIYEAAGSNPELARRLNSMMQSN